MDRGERRPDGSRAGWWYYQRTVRLPDGRKVRIHGKAPINTKRAAEIAEREHVERMLNPPPAEPEPVVTFAEFADTFTTSYVKARNKPSEQANKRRILAKHLTPRFGELRLDQIGRAEIDGLIADLRAGGRSKKTVNNVLAVLSKLLGYAVDLGALEAKPKMGMFKIKGQPFRFLDFEEYAALLEAAEPEPFWRVAILLAGDAGLRRGEIRGLERSHVHDATGRLVVSQALWHEVMGTPKGGGPRTIPLTARLRGELKRARHLRGRFVVPGDDGAPVSIEAMRWNLPRLCRKAGIEEIGWHALRHSFCSHLAMRGAPAKTIQELAGHTELSTTMRYMHLARGEKDRAIALLDQPIPQRAPSASAETK
jgi:integrase